MIQGQHACFSELGPLIKLQADESLAIDLKEGMTLSSEVHTLHIV